MATNVSPQATDAIAQANMTALGGGTAVATLQSFLSSTQAQGTLFASAVRRQEQVAIASLAATVKGAMQILALPHGAMARAAPPKPPSPDDKPKVNTLVKAAPPPDAGALPAGNSEAEMQKAERAMSNLQGAG